MPNLRAVGALGSSDRGYETPPGAGDVPGAVGAPDPLDELLAMDGYALGAPTPAPEGSAVAFVAQALDDPGYAQGELGVKWLYPGLGAVDGDLVRADRVIEDKRGHRDRLERQRTADDGLLPAG